MGIQKKKKKVCCLVVGTMLEKKVKRCEEKGWENTWGNLYECQVLEGQALWSVDRHNILVSLFGCFLRRGQCGSK